MPNGLDISQLLNHFIIHLYKAIGHFFKQNRFMIIF
jgi:hypothetical protein